MAKSLVGQSVGGWRIEKTINHGKSAVVFLAERNGQQAALKILDPEIVSRFGRENQLKRIQRERMLIGKSHPNLIRVFDGGEDKDLLFVAMEYFEGSNVAQVLSLIPASEVASMISQVAAAARFLEDSSFAHRDIKPENIGLSPDMKTAKLLDLGVIRALDLSNITDEGEQKFFIGTLQYSPPELLFREEEESINAWRAISFYQLGGVLHDLLVRKPLFSTFIMPYARLVRAVAEEIPKIDAPNVDPGLRLLAQNCLAKAPKHRLDTVKWDDFQQPPISDPLDAARRRIAQRRAAARAPSGARAIPDERDLRALEYQFRTWIESAVLATITSESLPRYSRQTISEPNPFILRVVFEPSAKHGLEEHFAFYCVWEIVDGSASFSALRVYACRSPSRETIPAEPQSTAPSLEKQGALIDQDIHAHIQSCLLLYYAKALDAGSRVDEVEWLEIGRMA